MSQVSKESPTISKESSTISKESPKKPVESPTISKESPTISKESPKKPVESPKKPVESPKKPVESPKKPVESPKKPVESPKKRNQSPKQLENLSKRHTKTLEKNIQPSENKSKILLYLGAGLAVIVSAVGIYTIWKTKSSRITEKTPFENENQPELPQQTIRELKEQARKLKTFTDAQRNFQEL